MNFWKSSYISAITNIISMVIKLIVNKITAVYIGPAGFAIYGQFKDFVALTTTISQLGTENGIIKYAAETSQNKIDFKKFIGNAVAIHLICSGITVLITIVFSNYISQILFNTTKYHNYINITIVSVFFVALYNLSLSVINGIKNLKFYTIISILATVASGIIASLMVFLFKLNGLICAIAINNLIIFIISFSLIKKYHIFDSNFKLEFNKKRTGQLLQYTAMSITGILTTQLTLIFIRSLIIDKFGNSNAGIWDSTWRISAMYYTFLIASFKFYVLPTFTKTKSTKLKSEIFKIWKLTLPSILLITAGIYLGKNLIIRLLFTPDFFAIGTIISFQLLGDIFRIHTWTLDNILVANAKTKKFIFLEISWGIIFCVSAVILVNTFNLKGITLAYAIACITNFIFANIAVKNILWFPKTD